MFDHPRITIEECESSVDTDEFKNKFKELREISLCLGKTTWQLTKLQTVLFGSGILLFTLSITI